MSKDNGSSKTENEESENPFSDIPGDELIEFCRRLSEAPLPKFNRKAMMEWVRGIRNDPNVFFQLCDEFDIPVPRIDINEAVKKMWTRDELKVMSTEEILNKLESMNVKFDEQVFKEQARGYISAGELADDHYFTQDHKASGLDEDFIWLAIMELWKRLIPDQANMEMLDDAMQDGYPWMIKYEHTKTIEEWEKAWTMVKTLIPKEIKSIKEAEDYLPEELTQDLEVWADYFDTELKNAGIDDSRYLRRRIEFCTEFIELFPESQEITIHNMYRGIAEAHLYMGDLKTADRLFQKLVERYPHNVWGYIGWADMYTDCFTYRNKSPDHDKAERIYAMGLEMCVQDREDIQDRIMDLAIHRNKQNE